MLLTAECCQWEVPNTYIVARYQAEQFGVIVNFNTMTCTYPFFLAPSMRLRTTLLLDFGVSGFSGSDGTDIFSVGIVSVAYDHKHKFIELKICTFSVAHHCSFHRSHYGLS